MTLTCIVCGRRYSNTVSVSFHRFPKNPELKNSWVQALGICSEIGVYSRICSLHFRRSEFIHAPDGRVFLKEGAMPTYIEDKENNDLDPQPGPSSEKRSCKVNILQNVLLTKPQSPKITFESPISQQGDSPYSSTDSTNFADEVYFSIQSPYCTKRSTDLFSQNVSPSTEQTETGSEARQYGQGSTTDTAFEMEESPVIEETWVERLPNKRLAEHFSEHFSKNASPSSERTITGSEARQYGQGSTTDTAFEIEEIPIIEKARVKIHHKKRKLTSSQIRYFGDIKLKDLENSRTVKKCWKIIKTTIANLRQKVAALQRIKIRKDSKISCQYSLMRYLKENDYLSEQATNTVQALLPSAAEDIFKRMRESKKRTKFDPELRAFALTLNFYSPKAYAFVRETFNNALPHQSTLTKWYRSVDGAPGFTDEALQAILLKAEEAEAAGKKIVCNLVFDEMAIRKKIEWTGVKTTGYINVGTGMVSDSIPVATQALVIMIVAVNFHWKVPIGYFLVNSLTAKEKAQLVLQSLEFIHQPNLIVSSLTFDGTAVNLNMCEELGAIFKIDKMQTYFSHPITKKNIFIFVDPPHMIKLVRNCLGEYKTITSNNKIIAWEYLEKLVSLQKSEDLSAAPKIKTRHVAWQNEKMKVKLATQVLSKSVSDALLFLSNDLQHPDFQGAQETANFVKIFNDLFDILNSRTCLAKYHYQKPLSAATKESFFNFMEYASTYIQSLHLNSRPILKSKRKTGFLGFIICMESLKEYYKYFVESETPLLKFIISYKFSQDHLEIFFSIIRSRGGFNNNPTSRQFEATYKRLLVHAEIKGSKYGNCSLLDSTSILQCSSRCTITGSPNDIISTLEVDDIHMEHSYADISMRVSEYQLSEYVTDIVAYIAGFVVKCIIKKVTCLDCITILEGAKSLSKLQERKQYGRMYVASSYVHSVCECAEKVFRYYKNVSNNVTIIKNINNVLITKCLEKMSPLVFQVFNEHKFEGDLYNSHFLLLTKMVLKTYINIRLHKECRNIHEDITRVRSKCTKYILFSNQ